jgi:hypothetical protein
MPYTDIKKVREMNGQQFIDDFKRVHTVGAYAYNSESFFTTQRRELWESAKVKKLHYMISRDVYVNSREVIIIL